MSTMVPVSTVPFLQVAGVSRAFRLGGGIVQALDNVCFQLAAPIVATLVGPSGSGKSTLLNILGCLEDLDHGTVQLDGMEITGLIPRTAANFRREKLGFIFQSFNLIAVMTARENVELALHGSRATSRERRERATEMLRAVGLGERFDHWPSQLSGGEQQRVAVARALVHRPALVLADEPTANLDSRNAAALIELMLQLNAELGTAFVIATHDDRLIARLGVAVRLQDGRIVA